MTKPNVALIGLGTMGSGMARRLLAAGFPLSVYNRNPARAAALGTEGAKIAGSPREAAANAQFVISMVADDNASRGVWLGPDGALSATVAGTIAIESSTLTVEWIGELARACHSPAFELLDAPVTGSKVHANSGELNFLVGGAADSLERARPILAVMSKTITHIGPNGSGALIKLINNFMCGVQAASLAEAVAVIEKAGLNRAQAVEILCNGAPGSPLVKTLSARMLAQDYTPNFFLRLMAKDLGYAQKEAAKQNVSLETVAGALRVFQSAIQNGHGDKDFSALVETFRREA